VELFVNGVSYGAKAYVFPHPGMSGREWHPEYDSIDYTTNDLHLGWDVLYQPGTIRRGRNNGQVVCEQEISTTGVPAALRLTADRADIAADSRDVVH
jgi:beta-galactosidase